MKVDSKLLNAALKRVAPAVSDSKTNPITGYVLIKNKKIYATNLALTYIEELECDSNEPFLIPHKDLLNITQMIDDTIEIKEEHGIIKLFHGFDIFEIGKPIDANQFPTVPDVTQNKIKVNSEFFTAIKNASRCVLDDELRIFKNISIWIRENEIEVAGTDAYILYRHIVPCVSSVMKNLVVHPLFARAILDFTNGTLCFNDNYISVEDAVTKIIMTLSEGIFPDYNPYFGKMTKPNVICNKKDLLQSLGKVMFYNLPIYEIDLSFDHDHITMQLVTPEISKSARSIVKSEISTDIEPMRMFGEKLKLVTDLIANEVIKMQVINVKDPTYFMNDKQTILLVPLIRQNNA